jgi:hypothetical protein
MLAVASYASQVKALSLTRDTELAWVLVTIVIILVVYYIWYDTLDAHFGVVSHSARIKSLENQINKIVGRKLMIWETVVAPKLWGSAHPFPGVVHPVRPMLFYQGILMFLIAVAFPFYVYYEAWKLPETTVPFKAILIAAAVFSVGSLGVGFYVWDRLNRRLSDRTVEFINKYWEPDAAPRDISPSVARIEQA